MECPTLVAVLRNYMLLICCPVVCVNRRSCQVSSTEQAWVGVGFSSNGDMPGSDAVIGLPDNSSVSEFNLTDKVRALLGCNLLVVLGVVVLGVVVAVLVLMGVVV